MSKPVTFLRKSAFVLWAAIFAACYLYFLYFTTNSVISSLYVWFLNDTVHLVNEGVVYYLMTNFAFFLVSLLVVTGLLFLILLGIRRGLGALCVKYVEESNLYRFGDICGLLLNFLIAVGFVFLLGIKDNFFEMYYALFEEGMSSLDVTIHRMAYDVELNWIFCEMLTFKAIFDFLFGHAALDKYLPELRRKTAPSPVYEVPEITSAEEPVSEDAAEIH